MVADLKEKKFILTSLLPCNFCKLVLIWQYVRVSILRKMVMMVDNCSADQKQIRKDYEEIPVKSSAARIFGVLMECVFSQSIAPGGSVLQRRRVSFS